VKATPTCIPCYLRQALSAAREVTDDPETQRHVVNEAARLLPTLSLDSTPARNSTLVLWRAQEALGCADPWAAKKKQYNELATKMYPGLQTLVRNSEEPLNTALRIAAAGNVMDLGILSGGQVDVEGVLDNLLSAGFTVDESELLERVLPRPPQVLYLLDNAGEAVFDKILIEELTSSGARVTAVARGAPILNDATVDDARSARLHESAVVINNGSPMIGTDLGSCSDEFRQLFDEADLIVSKGQANFETLNETTAPVFFILKAKCPEVARELGVATGDVVAVLNPLCSLRHSQRARKTVRGWPSRPG
jgi:uncharacterized protein with ATP-grasp and redox domains